MPRTIPIVNTICRDCKKIIAGVVDTCPECNGPEVIHVTDEELVEAMLNDWDRRAQ